MIKLNIYFSVSNASFACHSYAYNISCRPDQFSTVLFYSMAVWNVIGFHRYMARKVMFSSGPLQYRYRGSVYDRRRQRFETGYLYLFAQHHNSNSLMLSVRDVTRKWSYRWLPLVVMLGASNCATMAALVGASTIVHAMYLVQVACGIAVYSTSTVCGICIDAILLRIAEELSCFGYEVVIGSRKYYNHKQAYCIL